MRLAAIVAVAVIALLIGFGVGYLVWDSRALRAIDELEAMKYRNAQQSEDLRKLNEELDAERTRRQRLEDVISQGRK